VPGDEIAGAGHAAADVRPSALVARLARSFQLTPSSARPQTTQRMVPIFLTMTNAPGETVVIAWFLAAANLGDPSIPAHPGSRLSGQPLGPHSGREDKGPVGNGGDASSHYLLVFSAPKYGMARNLLTTLVDPGPPKAAVSLGLIVPRDDARAGAGHHRRAHAHASEVAILHCRKGRLRQRDHDVDLVR